MHLACFRTAAAIVSPSGVLDRVHRPPTGPRTLRRRPEDHHHHIPTTTTIGRGRSYRRTSALRPPVVWRRSPGHQELPRPRSTNNIEARLKRPKNSAVEPPIVGMRPPRHWEKPTEAPGAPRARRRQQHRGAAGGAEELGGGAARRQEELLADAARLEMPTGSFPQPGTSTTTTIESRPERAKYLAAEAAHRLEEATGPSGASPPLCISSTNNIERPELPKYLAEEPARPSNRGHRPTVSSPGTAADFEDEDLGSC
ncbi:hypothetical protein TYRP_014698 [Tyrophagus putrescentiae]|nr:hypothetical protein TYRP_014698 [Tyrophagus putrescentiae]